ncbi:MAG: hypothetical protein JWO22_1264 [Frankiales bacterium]|nr:hypothetical protein [Frankiales bacterium]
MGSVTFSIPLDLATALVEAAGLRYAVETGTYLGASALMLDELVDEVWSIELKPEILEQARANCYGRPTIHLVEGYSPEVLPALLQQVPGPALFWLDGHGGTFGANDTPSHIRECPVLEEIALIDDYAHAAGSVILVDDARAFFGPLLHHRPEDWPTFVQVAQALGPGRYVTVLDDVVVAVPSAMRPVVDAWWTGKLRERDGLDAHPYLISKLMDPEWVEDFKRVMG